MDPDRLLNLRADYESEGLSRSDLTPEPFELFVAWFSDALESGLVEPHAFVLATAGGEARPSARTVLVREMDSRGIVFYTNYQSRKGAELAANPRASAVFLWMPLHRQVRIEGRVEKVAAAQSDAYFSSRPPGSRLSAASSPQSETIPSRAWLEERTEELRRRYPDGDLPRPEEWGGYRLNPDYYEFWRGRPSRLHDRFEYRLRHGAWVTERLAP
ncbi:MAG: pyridoxamine 5'-phosphate oxidase [Acidimicrobiia bacterium]|nr:pyridoxamine 5'-phosphate oxidase [Acidimicrobiia bacterium]MYA39799.1 pyridoxamine 5'-phosphate oxidase [Acidimicrobiia bacterium]MYB78820.1 pyridoxamine 5'-phosphate oxidase [Acidimicrobiia bacterium]